MLKRVFVRILRMDHRPGRTKTPCRRFGRPAPPADEMHLHAGILRANIFSPVSKRGQVEVGTQLAVDPLEHVQVECPCDAVAVVIGGPDDRDVLVEVEPHEQPAAIADEPGDRAEEIGCRPWAEVADRRAREIDDASRLSGSPVSGSNKGSVKSPWTGRMRMPGKRLARSCAERSRGSRAMSTGR